MSRQRHRHEKALDRLILELRQDPGKDVDWERIETRLLRESRALTRRSAAPWLSRWHLPAAGLLGCAALSAVLIARRPKVATPRLVARSTAHALNGDSLTLGTRVSAARQPVTVDHRGRASWTLEPQAAAVLAESGDFLTVRLERGALSARVVPNPKPETFAVEVGGTRVAVHGTAFRVERVGDLVRVSVSEGTVAVEPAGARSAPSFVLRRDSRGSFALDGRTGSVEGNASVVSQSLAQSHREIARPTAARSTSTRPPPRANDHDTARARSAELPGSEAALPELPQQPSISDTEQGVSAALELMNGCFRDQTHSNGIRISASTALTLTVSSAGTVQSVTFAPPLAPAVEDCAVNGLTNLSFPRSLEGVTFTRVFELAR